MLRAVLLSAAILWFSVSASAAPRSDDGEDGREQAFGLQLQQWKDDLAAHAASASWVALSERPLGPSISLDRPLRGNAYGHRFRGWKPKAGSPLPKGPGPVSAIPEPSGALLFGAGAALLTLRLRRVR